MVRCIRVPKRDGESVRTRLLEEGILDASFRIGSDGDSLLMPVLIPVEGFECEEGELRPQDRPVGDYRHLLDLPDGLSELLPISFDVVGDVGMIKVPDELSAYRKEIGEAMMRANRSLRCVFSDSGVKGDLRVRDLELMAGEGPSETVHREFGARMHTDPARVYFNPRLAGERHRVASQVKDGEVVIDMFAGVAPFGIQMCRFAEPSVVYSIDLNPDAEHFAVMNRRDNHADALVPITGDANDVVPTLPKADRIVMNLPQIADRFLPLALDHLNRGGTVHMYKIIEREDFPRLCEEMAAMSAEAGHSVSMDTFELKTYSPTMSVYSIDVHLLRAEEAPRLVRPDDSDRLEVRVHRHRSDESHPALLQIVRYRIGQRAPGDAVLFDHRSVRPFPQVVRERSELLPYRQERLRVPYGRDDLRAVPDDPGVRHQSGDVVLAVRRDPDGIEAVERLPERVPFVQDALPRQSGLEALQQEHLVQLPVVVHRDAPLRIVVLDVPGVRRVRPGAPGPPVAPDLHHAFGMTAWDNQVSAGLPHCRKTFPPRRAQRSITPAPGLIQPA